MSVWVKLHYDPWLGEAKALWELNFFRSPKHRPQAGSNYDWSSRATPRSSIMIESMEITAGLNSLLAVAHATRWVRLPPELGGQRVEVTGMTEIRCPGCQGQHIALTLPENMMVTECRGQYLWLRSRRGEE